jgi:hypothetical protein
MRNKKCRNWILAIIGGSLIIYIANFLYGAIKQDIRNPGGMVLATAPSNYINLFKSTAQEKMAITYTSFAKYRDSITYLVYDKKYDIEISKIRTITNLNLEKDIIDSYKEPNGFSSSNTVGVAPYNENNFEINYKGESTETASKIYLSLLGDSIKTIVKNDSIANYFLNVKGMFVQYKPDNVYQFYIEAKKHFYFFSEKQPVSLMFLKKNNILYFLLLTTKNDEDKLDSNLLYKLVK